MELVVAVVVVALASAMVSAIATARPGPTGPVESEAVERGLVRWVKAHPRLHRFVRVTMSPASVGGTLVVVGFGLAAAVAATLGLLLRAADGGGTFASWDESLSEWGVAHADSSAVDVLKAVTELGGTRAVVAVAIVVAVVDWVRHRNPSVLAFLAVVVIGQNVLVNVLKVLVDRERPNVLHLVSVHVDGPSFPSGHSTAAAACWAAFALVLTRRSSRGVRSVAAGLAVLVAVAVAASRALLGVHWATDVIGGVALGWAWFTFAAVAFGGRLQRFGEPAERLDAARPPGGHVGAAGPR